jgi:hypothetical protein
MASARRPFCIAHAMAAALLAVALPAAALQVDDRGEMRLGMRAYTDVRIGTEEIGGSTDPLSFPRSATGHVRQDRYFLEIKFDHDLTRLANEGRGLAALLRWLRPSSLKYSLQYRGEGEGIYNYGPDEYNRPSRALLDFRAQAPLGIGAKLDPTYIKNRVNRLNRLAVSRNRFFLGYLDIEKGPVFVRIGRQILAWGETDVFQLLDHINPLDASFGGFFIALDERRQPLDMARGSYQLGSVGPLHDSFLEGFLATGHNVATFPGIPLGSPWQPGGLNSPNQLLFTTNNVPAYSDFRGGGRFVFNYGDATFSLAHYYTYFDTPGVTFRVPGGLPSFANPIIATQRFPRIPVTGGSVTFPVPSQYLIVRGEAAYFKNEPFNRQGTGSSADSATGPGTPGYNRLVAANNLEGSLNPFVYPDFTNFCLFANQPGCRKTDIQSFVLKRDSFNMAIGLDRNQWIRWLNPAQTFFISGQFFYKHVFNSPGDLTLPVPFRDIPVNPGSNPVLFTCVSGKKTPCVLQPRFFHLNDDQFLNTLAIYTSYNSGRITPIISIFYDWQGVVVVQPGVTFTYDPFRLVMDWTSINGAPTGQLGTQRDRDNFRVQVEYAF